MNIEYKFKRTNKQTKEEEWIFICDDVSDYGWTNDYDRGDYFSTHNIFLNLTKELNIELDFENYDYLLEKAE